MRYYTNKEIRDFISCPQFGDIKYGKWGSQKLEIRETLLHLITINEEMDKMLKDRLLRIDKAIEYINNRIYYFNEMERDYMKEYFPSESWEYENILNILKGSDSNENE